MQSIVESLLLILEKPNVKKGYKEFKNYLQSVGKIYEANAFALLLEKKFDEFDHSDIDKK
jgi:hypothetical protein